MKVPFFRPSIGETEIAAVVECLRSGWLTTGPRTKEFERKFAEAVGARHAIAVNSCTAALHLALEAIGLQRGELVLVPTMTFAATAEVVRYFDATPVFVDCDPQTLCMDPQALANTLAALAAGQAVAGLKPPYGAVRAIIPVHYGGQMVDVDAIAAVARRYELPVVEDAAHTLPAFYRSDASAPWRRVGTTADITCFSFYANKCITTGEGGMAVTDRDDLAERMRLMSLHGMSKDAWKRFMGNGAWYYEIIAPGFKYNLTDVAAAIGLCQLEQAEKLWQARCEIARALREQLADVAELQLPTELPNRRHAWHLFAVQLELSRLSIDRARFIELLNERGISASVHWMPLHMQPYYREVFDYEASAFPTAAGAWPRLVSLPIFPGMTQEETFAVADAVKGIAREHARRG
ncbi:MAG: DegT/DnrJ/EryC1/StrS family aminotransferase [Polyangiaceae bacterium]